MRGSSQRHRALRLVIVAAVLVALLTTVGAGVGSDAISVFQYEPSEPEAEQGETFTIGVELLADSPAHDIGVDRVETEARYDGEVLVLQDVERGEWMDRGEETDVEMSVEESPGEVTIRQVRDPARGGVTGTATFVELTFEVAADAEPGDYTLSYGDSEVQMINDHYQPVFTHNATLTVVEGDSTEDGQTEDGDGGAGENSGDGGSNGDENSDGNGERDGADADTVVGFGLVVAGVSVLALVGVLVARRARP